MMREPESMTDTVPCNTCNACCRFDGSMVKRPILLAREVYKSTRDAHDQRRIACKDNGDCVYLDRTTGCTIHAIRPQACRTWDCRNDAQKAKTDKILAEYLGPGVLKGAQQLQRRMRR